LSNFWTLPETWWLSLVAAPIPVELPGLVLDDPEVVLSLERLLPIEPLDEPLDFPEVVDPPEPEVPCACAGRPSTSSPASPSPATANPISFFIGPILPSLACPESRLLRGIRRVDSKR
jgi:hypothetical protein